MKSKALFFVLCLICITVLVSCNLKKTNQMENKKTVITQEKEKEESEEIKPDESEKLKFRIVNLYFVNPDTDEVDIEKRQVFDLKERTSMIKQVLRSLKLGPVGNLKPSVPQNIEFKDVFVYKDTVYIDIHKNNEDSTIGGVKGEELFIESVVKTVLSLSDDYKKVVFLVDGEPVDTLLGHIDVSQSFSEKSF